MSLPKGNYNFIYTDEELDLIKRTFAENEQLLKLMRKVFLPQITDTAADIGGMSADVGLHPDLTVKNYPSLEQAMIGIEARSVALQHIESSLWKIKQLAGFKNETVAELKARLQKDSSK
jgi:hypothetical protein